jgi:hypothetical protein
VVDRDANTRTGKSKQADGEQPNKFRLEKKRNDESFREFNARVERETQERLMETSKKKTRKAEKAKLRSKARKEKLREKKEKRTQKKQDDMDDKERRVYNIAAANRRGLVNDQVEAPPEFEALRTIKGREMANPSDNRSRFARLTGLSRKLSSSASGAAAEDKKAKSKGGTDYEREQMEALRARVVGKYNELKAQRQHKKF